MNCYIQIKRTDKCVACHTPFQKDDKVISVRIQDNAGYNISSMCESCMDAVILYKKRKKELIGV